MSTTDNIISECANCGKGEDSSGDLKACMACKSVKYCNRECQIAHRPLHKKACKKRAAELHDEALFKEHPPRDDCPICFLPLPLNPSETTFKSCCGKKICGGCIVAMMKESFGRGKTDLCAFCREPIPNSDEEERKQIKKLIDADNAQAFNLLAADYERGVNGMPQDFEKAEELMLRAGELGCAEAYHNLGYSYYSGEGVEADNKKAKYLFELAAMNGDVRARYNLGQMEEDAGNDNRAMKHYILAVKAGDEETLDKVKQGFTDGFVTKDDYADALRTHQKARGGMKSAMRDRAEKLTRNLDNANY